MLARIKENDCTFYYQCACAPLALNRCLYSTGNPTSAPDCPSLINANSDFSASSSSEGPGFPVVGGNDVWCSRDINLNQYLTVDLGKCGVSHFYREVFKGRYTLGDKLQQQVAATDHSVCTGPATSCSTMLWRQIASCVLEKFGENLCLCNRILSPRQVAQILSDLIFCNMLFHKTFPVHTKQFVFAATCRLVCTDLKANNFISIHLLHHN